MHGLIGTPIPPRDSFSDTIMDKPDFLIIGGGSAGAVLAAPMIKKSGLSMMVSEKESRGAIGCQSTHA